MKCIDFGKEAECVYIYGVPLTGVSFQAEAAQL